MSKLCRKINFPSKHFFPVEILLFAKILLFRQKIALSPKYRFFDEILLFSQNIHFTPKYCLTAKISVLRWNIDFPPTNCFIAKISIFHRNYWFSTETILLPLNISFPPKYCLAACILAAPPNLLIRRQTAESRRGVQNRFRGFSAWIGAGLHGWRVGERGCKETRVPPTLHALTLRQIHR